MERRCQFCGLILKEIDSRGYCPNHGFVDSDKKSLEKKEVTYIG
jgi:uncharacterized Zn finger protein (UPF0148 family)